MVPPMHWSTQNSRIKKDKKHASDLSPYPAELIAFEPMDGPDTHYGQLYKPISSTALNEDGKTYDEDSVHGFTPFQSI